MRRKPLIGITLDRNEAGNYARSPWYALRENYCLSFEQYGGAPLPIPPIASCALEYIDKIDGLVITGGDFDIDPRLFGANEVHPSVKLKPIRTEAEILLVKLALEKDIPILGICGGEQVINVALGGTLIQHIPDSIPNALSHSTGEKLSHTIKIDPESKLFKIIQKNEILVNSSHHQSVAQLGRGIQISARAEDGVIEGIELKDHKFCMGVQWHPEYLNSNYDSYLFQALVDAAR